MAVPPEPTPPNLYLHIFLFVQGTAVPPGPNPPNLLDKQLSFVLPVIFDHAPFGSHFGDVVTDAKPSYIQVIK